MGAMAADRAIPGGRPLLSGSCTLYCACPWGGLLPPDPPRDNTILDPSSDMLRAMAVKWLFLGGRDSPFLHCSRDLEKVKKQAWNTDDHHVILRVQLAGQHHHLDRDDVIDLSTYEAQVRFFEKLRPPKFFDVNTIEGTFLACYNNLLPEFDLKTTWVEALRNGVNEKVVLLKWRGFVPFSGMTVIYVTSSSGWNKVSGENIAQWLTSSFSQRHVLQTALCRECLKNELFGSNKYRKRMEQNNCELLSVDCLEEIDARRMRENAAAPSGSQPHMTSVPEEVRGDRGSAAHEPEEPRAEDQQPKAIEKETKESQQPDDQQPENLQPKEPTEKQPKKPQPEEPKERQHLKRNFINWEHLERPLPPLKLQSCYQKEQSGAAAAPQMQPVAPPQPLQHARSGDPTRLLADFDADFFDLEQRFEEASTFEPVKAKASLVQIEIEVKALESKMDSTGLSTFEELRAQRRRLLNACGGLLEKINTFFPSRVPTVTGAQGSATSGAAPQPSAGAVGQPPPPPPPPPQSAGAAVSDARQPRAVAGSDARQPELEGEITPEPVQDPQPKKRPLPQPVQDPQAKRRPKPQGPAAQEAPETQGTQGSAEHTLELYSVFMTLHKEGVFQDARCLNTEVAVTEQEYHEHLLVSQSGVRVPHYWANWWLRILRLKDHGG